jgi:hypothetical protein
VTLGKILKKFGMIFLDEGFILSRTTHDNSANKYVFLIPRYYEVVQIERSSLTKMVGLTSTHLTVQTMVHGAYIFPEHGR